MQPFRRLARHVAFAMLAILFTGQWVSSAPPNTLKETTLGTTRNVHQVGNLFLAGQPSEADFKILKQRKITRVITLRADSEIEWDEAAVAKAAGISYLKIPIAGLDAMNDDTFDAVRKQLKLGEKAGTLLHCASANRVGAVWLVYRVLDQGVELEEAVQEAKEVGMRVPIFETKARAYIRKHQDRQNPDETSVRPGINKRFLDANLKVDEWIDRFEIESREVYAARNSIVKTTKVKAGTAIADIGAGTGFFTQLFSAAVGDKGQVYAVDISPRFIDHIEKHAKQDGLKNIKTVQCEENSVALPPASIDVAFTCDTYHHFEYPASTLASIHKALRPGGLLVIVDFERIEGKSKAFIMDHVRAGKEVFLREIEAAGFKLLDQSHISDSQENYVLRFTKQ
ncbi:MAG: methyltransferase domain-containing protein [Planctomycetaceae bacterium]|nr:methyltransferase domain-containing protein [Planctomycetaceae bacterium]